MSDSEWIEICKEYRLKLDAAEARIKELQLMLTALGDLAVGNWDDATVGKVDAAIPHEVQITYKDLLRSAFYDIPKERRALAIRVKELEQQVIDHWGIVESIACGEGLECPLCGKQRPCTCSDLGAPS
jgi:hypothetical protein